MIYVESVSHTATHTATFEALSSGRRPMFSIGNAFVAGTVDSSAAETANDETQRDAASPSVDRDAVAISSSFSIARIRSI